MSDLTVKPLTPALGADFLRFFDHERGAAFADNPEWAKCYCHFYQVPQAIDWPALTASQNRTAMQARIEVGAMDGFLALDGADVVGWLNAQPRDALPHCFDRMRIEPTPLPCEAFEAAVIVCFVVAPQKRRQGIARVLLAAALASFAARGIKLVDAFPFKSGASEFAADHYHGSLSLFLDQGFTVLREDETMTVVRKILR
jgi:GNAT superfamily N-acetyltransferase